MINLTKYQIKNGPLLILYNDNNKSNTRADFFINFGGNNKEVIINNEKIKITHGIAHFIEHLLLEHSMYGNIINYYDENKIISNGLTYNVGTRYYIDTTKNFKDYLLKEINVINQAFFNKTDIETTKQAIIKERMMKNDSIYHAIYKMNFNSVFKNYIFPNTIGETDDIKSINYDETKRIYDIFYHPTNQVIVVSGKFVEKEIIKLIKDEYNKIKKPKINYNIPKYIEPKEVAKETDFIKKNINKSTIYINYKLYIGDKPFIEKDDFISKILLFTDENFGSTSSVYKYLVEHKIIDDNIEINVELEGDYCILSIGGYTEKHEEFVSQVQKIINNPKYTKDFFELAKIRNIIKFIQRNDSLLGVMNPFFDNVRYGYYKLDTIENFENEIYEEYLTLIKKVDFSNYSITKILKDDGE